LKRVLDSGNPIANKLFLPSSICRFARVTGKVLPTHPVCLWPEETFIIYMLISVINSPQRHLPVVVGTSPLFFPFFFHFFSDLNKSLNTSLCHRSGERGGSIKRPFYGPFVHLSSQPKAPGNCGNALLPWPERLLICSRQRRQIIDTTIKLHNNQNNTRFTTNQQPVK